MLTQYHKPPTTRRGLSLIEVLLVLGVLSIMLIIAWPRFSTWRQTMLRNDLVEALDDGDRDEAVRLLKQGAPPDAWSGSTPHYCLRCKAVVEGDLEMARLLFPQSDFGGSVRSERHPPFLNVAVARNDVAIAALLLEGTTSLDGRVRYGYSKNIMAGSPGEALDAIRTLLLTYSKAGRPIPREHLDRGLVPKVIPQHLIHPTPEIDVGNPATRTRKIVYMNTLLHDAVMLDSAPMLQLLLDHEANPDLTDENDETALQLARHLGREPLVTLLMEAGATVP